MNLIRVRWGSKLRILVPLFALLSMLLSACGGTDAANTAIPAANTAVSDAGTAVAGAVATDTPAAALATATSGQGAATTVTSGGKTLMVISVAQQSTWVRNFNPFSSDFRFPTIHGIYEPMMIYNTVKGELQPWLATAYKFSADNKTLTVTLRSDVKWSDGQPFTSADVAYTFNLFKSTNGLQGSGGNAMNGATAYVDTVTAPDATTVVFNFKNVFTPGLYDIMNQDIVAEHTWKTVADPVKFTNDNPVGTGPFTQVTNFQPQTFTVEKNPNYWQPGKPYFDGLVQPAYPGNDQANLATTNGTNDYAANFIPDIEKVYTSKNPNYGYWFPSVGATVMLYLNTTKAPFDNVDVRKAISMAIDRDQIANVAEYGYTKPADVTGLSDAYPSYKVADPSTLGTWTTMDVAKANAALDAAGLKKGADGIRLKADGTPMTYDINVVDGWSDWVSACQIMADGLKAVGINATVKGYPQSTWQDRVQNGNFDMSIGWSSGGATPFNYYRGQMSSMSYHDIGVSSGENWQRYKSTTADTLLNQFASASDPAQQKSIAEQLQKTFADEAPAIPLFPGPSWYEYNTTRFTDFPTKDNPYAVGSWFNSGTPEQLILMTTIKPK